MPTATLYLNDAANEVLFQLVSSSDHLTPITGRSASVTVQQRPKGGSWATPLSAISEVGFGWYKYTGNAADFATVGSLNVRAYDTGTDIAEYVYEVQAVPLTTAAITTAVWAAGTRSLTGYGTLISDIWAAITDSAGVTTLLGRLTSGRATKLDNLDAASSSLATAIVGVQTDTTNLKTRLPAALSGGLIPSVVPALGAPVGASISADIAAIQADTNELQVGLTAPISQNDLDAIAAALLDAADGVETGLTTREALRGMAAVLLGKVSDAGTASEKFRAAISDEKVRVTATVDASGNRTAITTDFS